MTQRNRYFWFYLIIALLISLLAETLIIRKPHFALDSFGFFAWYGFLSSLGLILVAKLIALFIQRNDQYYQDSDRNND